MFFNISPVIAKRMVYLEEIDARDRSDGTPKLQRLRQVPAETGKFLALLAANAPAGIWIEVGTSAGYSALWLSLACRLRAQKLKTFETLSEKVILAEETFALAGVDDLIELVNGDARQFLDSYNSIAFGFLDAEKDVYLPCYELIVPNMVAGGWLIADNVISHQAELQPFLDTVLDDPRLDSVVVPIGNGLLICRRV